MAGAESRLARFGPPMMVLSAFCLAASVSWRRWGSLLVDTGRELELPRRIAEGRILYAQERYYWGPLAPYLNAALYRVFGVSLDVLMWAGLVSAAASCVAIYLLARQYLRRWLAAAVATSFVSICAFQHLNQYGIFNFVLPFNFSATYGMAAALWSLLLLVLHLRSGARAQLAGSLICLTLATLTKAEVVFAVGTTHLVFLVMAGRRKLSTLLAAYGLVGVAVAGIYGSLYAQVGATLWHDNLAILAGPASKYYLAATSGFADVGASLWLAAGSALALFAALSATFAASRWGERQPRGRAVVAAGAAGLATAALYATLPNPWALRVTPFLMAAVLAAILSGRLQFRSRAARSKHLLLWTFGLAALVRIALRVSPLHYGFYLLPVGLICLAVFVSDYAPRLAHSRAAGRRVFVLASAGLLLGCSAAVWRVSLRAYGERTVEIHTARGTLRAMRTSPEPALVDLLSTFHPLTAVATVPQGVGLVFMAGLRSSGEMTSYLPMELPDSATEARIDRELRNQPPDLVLWWRCDLRALGSRGFGVDYAGQTANWILDHYRPLGDPSREFVLLARDGA